MDSSRLSTLLTPQVKVVLLCSSFGQTLAQEAQQTGVSLGSASHGTHVTKGFLALAGTPVLEHWLSAASKCSRLQPLSANLVVVSNADNHQELQAWAISAGLPETAVISTGVTASEQRRGAVADVALAVQQCGLEGYHLLVVDCDYALEPGYSLSRVVEAAIVRGKDTIMHITPFEGADLGQQTTMELAAPTTCTTGSIGSMTSTGGRSGSAASGGSRVTALDAAASGPADGYTAVLAPVCVLHRASIPALLEAAANASSCSNGPSWRCMGAFLQQRVEAGAAVYALPLDYHFSVRTLEDYQLTSAFFVHLLKLRAALGREVQGADLDAAMARQQPKEQQALLGSTVGKLTAKLHTLGAPQASSGGAGSVRELFMEWYVQRQQQQAQQGHAATTRDMKVVPDRFQDAGAWNHKPKQEHACYNTTNSAYGCKKPTGFDMPLTWAGAKGLFTETFHGGCYRSMGLSTAVVRSKVHRSLDEL